MLIVAAGRRRSRRASATREKRCHLALSEIDQGASVYTRICVDDGAIMSLMTEISRDACFSIKCLYILWQGLVSRGVGAAREGGGPGVLIDFRGLAAGAV